MGIKKSRSDGNENFFFSVLERYNQVNAIIDHLLGDKQLSH